jgi:hypothetical protein
MAGYTSIALVFFLSYNGGIMAPKKLSIFRTTWFRSALALALMGGLTGCPKPPPPPTAAAPTTVVAPPTTVVEEPPVADGLVYYPDYEVYYDPVGAVYWSYSGGAWVSGPAPIGVSLDVLLHAPSAHMNFRGSPAEHHAEVVRQYPHGWRGDDRRGH